MPSEARYGETLLCDDIDRREKEPLQRKS